LKIESFVKISKARNNADSSSRFLLKDV